MEGGVKGEEGKERKRRKRKEREGRNWHQTWSIIRATGHLTLEMLKKISMAQRHNKFIGTVIII